jgi:hypothetical protein
MYSVRLINFPSCGGFVVMASISINAIAALSDLPGSNVQQSLCLAASTVIQCILEVSAGSIELDANNTPEMCFAASPMPPSQWKSADHRLLLFPLIAR